MASAANTLIQRCAYLMSFASLILLYCGFPELDDVHQILDAERLP
jgi:hypothetical protein